MCAASVVCFLLAVSALAHPVAAETTENSLLKDIRKALMQDNVDYDSSTFPGHIPRSNRFRTATNAPRRKPKRSTDPHRFNFNRFDIITRARTNDIQRNQPEFRAIDDTDRQHPDQDRIFAELRKNKSNLFDVIKPQDKVESNLDTIRLLLKDTELKIPDNTVDFNKKLGPAVPYMRADDELKNFRAHMFENLGVHSAWRYKPTTKMMTTTTIRTFHTNPLPSTYDSAESGYAKAKRFDPGAYVDWNVKVVQPTPIPRLHRKDKSAKTRTAPTLTWGPNYWTKKTFKRRVSRINKSRRFNTGLKLADRSKLNEEIAFKKVVSQALKGEPQRREEVVGQQEDYSTESSEE